MNDAQFSFDEETTPGHGRRSARTPTGFTVLLIRYSGGVIKSETQADVILIVTSLLLLSTAIFHLTTSRPPQAPEHMRGVPDAELEAYRAVQPF